MNLEIWKNIEEFPDYVVSNMGKVKSFKNYKQWKPKISKIKVGRMWLHV